VPVPARAGDIVVFSSLTPHLTGPNTSDSVRRPTSCIRARRCLGARARPGERRSSERSRPSVRRVARRRAGQPPAASRTLALKAGHADAAQGPKSASPR
jgi:hypothetical protein